MTEGAFAGMTEGAFAGRTERALAGRTERGIRHDRRGLPLSVMPDSSPITTVGDKPNRASRPHSFSPFFVFIFILSFLPFPHPVISAGSPVRHSRRLLAGIHLSGIHPGGGVGRSSGASPLPACSAGSIQRGRTSWNKRRFFYFPQLFLAIMPILSQKAHPEPKMSF